MTPRVTTSIIVAMWLFAIIPTVYSILVDVNGVTDMPENGTCLFDENGFFETIILVSSVTSILTIALNVYSAMKAYQVQKQIEKETRLAGHDMQSVNLKTLKKKQHNIIWNWKPIITLLVAMSFSWYHCSFWEGFSSALRFFKTSWTTYIIFPNTEFVLQFFYASCLWIVPVNR